MKVGDLVRDIDVGDYGIITAIDRHGLYMIIFFNGTKDWLRHKYLEVISESR